MDTTYDLIYTRAAIRLAFGRAMRTVVAIVRAEPTDPVWRNADPAAQFGALPRAQQDRLLDRGFAPRI